MTMKELIMLNSKSVNPLYLFINKIDGSFQEKNGNKYLIFDSTDKKKEVFIKLTKLWDGIKNSIEKVNNKLGEFGKDFMKINFSSDDKLSLNKKLHNMTIIIRLVFKENGKLYPRIFLVECLYEF